MTGRSTPNIGLAEFKQESRPSSGDGQPVSLNIEDSEATTSESSSTSGDNNQQRDPANDDRETRSSKSDVSDNTLSVGAEEVSDEAGKTETTTAAPGGLENPESKVSEQSDQPVTLESKLITTPYVETDLKMSELADQMNRAIAFSAPVVASVQVRKGYMFDLEVSGPEFWRR